MNLLQSLSPDGRQLAKAEKLAKKIGSAERGIQSPERR